jgi:hypothetical protein
MGNPHGTIPPSGVSVLLVDSAQGQPIQTGRFSDQTEITIGREDGQDVVIPDPHVSRHHVTLIASDGDWMCGRHGTLIDRQYVKDVLSVMLTRGMYDYAGEWAYRVGVPAKSGVGGGICAVAPGRYGIGIFSPLLDPRGNSVRGSKVCEEFSDRFGLHSFELGFGGPSLEDEFQLRRSR